MSEVTSLLVTRAWMFLLYGKFPYLQQYDEEKSAWYVGYDFTDFLGPLGRLILIVSVDLKEVQVGISFLNFKKTTSFFGILDLVNGEIK